jgi:antitoxin YefM
MVPLTMNVHTASSARAKLFQLIDEVAEAHEPIQIIGKRNRAVLLSEEDWRAVQETLYLLSIPKMRASLRKAAREPLARMSRKVRW